MRAAADRMHGESRRQAGQAAATTADLLGLAMQVLRAAERGHTGTVRRCIVACPRLGELVAEPLQVVGQRGAALQLYRDLVLELSRTSAVEQLAALR